MCANCDTKAGPHHMDEPGCPCGLCEPAAPLDELTLGAVLSGNLACEFPACSIRGDGCMWGPGVAPDCCRADAVA